MVFHILASLAYYPSYLTLSSCWVPELTAQRELLEAVLVSGVPGFYYLLCERRAMQADRPSA